MYPVESGWVEGGLQREEKRRKGHVLPMGQAADWVGKVLMHESMKTDSRQRG